MIQRWKAKIKNNRSLLHKIMVWNWIFFLLRNPLLGFFTLIAFIKLNKCGSLVSFSRTMILRNPDNIEIGQGSSFSNFVILDGHDHIIIGKNCMFANKVTIATATHDYTIDPMNSRLITKPVKISDNVWIGIGATILPGVTIGEGAVIGAMSLVTKDIPARAIAMGVPAKVVKFR